jgi:hypothetical protein
VAGRCLAHQSVFANVSSLQLSNVVSTIDVVFCCNVVIYGTYYALYIPPGTHRYAATCYFLYPAKIVALVRHSSHLPLTCASVRHLQGNFNEFDPPTIISPHNLKCTTWTAFHMGTMPQDNVGNGRICKKPIGGVSGRL